MELKEIKGLVISTYTDEIFKFSYLRLLTESSVELLKINGNLNDYKYHFLLNPQYILSIETLKTRKNWILKDVIAFNKIFTLTAYNHFVKLSEFIRILSDSCTDGQDIHILPWIIMVISEKIEGMTIEDFKIELEQKINFKV